MTGDVTHDLANRLEHRVLAAEEATRRAQRQDQQVDANRLSEGTQDAQRVQQRQVVTQGGAVRRLVDVSVGMRNAIQKGRIVEYVPQEWIMPFLHQRYDDFPAADEA